MFDSSFWLLFLICVFAIGSWIDVNGVWVELPLLIKHLPENMKLPTYVVAIVQLANIGPLIYMGIYHLKKFKNMERFTIYLILGVGCIACVLLAIFWNHTVDLYLFGAIQKTSLAFFILIWILSMLDTTSSVTFLPYLISYPSQYLTALYVGEGLSGFLAGIAGLIQGVGGDAYCINKTIIVNGTNETRREKFIPDPRFSVSGFFVFLCILLIFCFIAFSLVDNVKYFRQFKTKGGSSPHKYRFENSFPLNKRDSTAAEMEKLLIGNKKSKSNIKWIIYIILVGFINFFGNGVLPSVQNYSLVPYSSNLYHLVVSISQILNPLACLLTIRKWKTNNLAVTILTAIGALGTTYIIFLACYSPKAFLNETILGQILAASCWFIVSMVFSFEKTLLAIELQKQGHIWLQMCGASTQIGSALGALLIFILVAVLDLFKSNYLIC